MPPETAAKNAEPLKAEEAPWTYWMESATHYAHFPLRLALVAVFSYKFVTKFQDLGAFADMTGLPVFASFLVALAEVGIVTGAIVGAIDQFPWADAATRIAGGLVIITMLGAIGIMHWPNWAFMDNGMEYQVTMMLIGLYLVLRGNRI